MADVQSSADIDATAKKLRDNDPPPLPPDPNVGLGLTNDKVSGQLTDVYRRKAIADESAAGAVSGATAQIPHLEQLSKDAGVEAGRMKPWNEEAEAAKRESDPIANFASLGSVFGILASAFTHAPMQNSLEASAAAMNAIKAGNDQDYQRAYKAWQDNTKQALERHKIEHEKFEDALSLLKTNMEAGMTQLRINAIRFGDEKTKVLIENGMLPELLEAQAAKATLAPKIQEAMDKAETDHLKLSRYWALVKQNGGKINGDATDEPHQKAYQQWQKELAEQKRSEHGVSFSNEWLTERTAELVNKEGLDPNSARIQATTEQSQAKKGGLTGGQLLKQKEKEQNVEAVSNQIDYAIDLIDKGKKTGDSVVGVKGAIGKAYEWFTGTESQHDRFTSQIKQIQQQVKPLLTGSTRALMNVKDRADMDKIVAGLGYFTTEKEARDTLADLKKRLNHINLLAEKDALPLPERFKNVEDGTEIPRKSDGKIYVKKGNSLVPKD